jgi:hypothetical protein
MESADIYSLVQLGIIGGAVIIAIIGVCISAPFVVRYWYLARRAEMELGLKQAMIERGMTAQQICAVIETSEGRPSSPPRPPITPNNWKEWAHNWREWVNAAREAKERKEKV